MGTFRELGIDLSTCEFLKNRGILVPTPVQEQAIPVIQSGKDAIVQSQTGTGKTLAFLLPIFGKLKKNIPVTQGLVIAPTRELAIQICKVASAMGKAAGIDVLPIYGGQDILRQMARLKRNPHLIVGTPGRLLDHIRRRSIDISHANKVVIDEADEMLRLGFLEDVELLLQGVAGDRQLTLFSATIPDRIRALAHRYMESPVQVTVKSPHVTIDSIKQIIIDTTEDTKTDRLCRVINEERPYLAMVFCRTRKRTAEVAMELARRGYLAEELHGELTQTQRALVLRRFRKAELQILVATDMGARGLDIQGVTHVINYDIPKDTESYIHRIGRTGRAGEAGTAITFVNARQYDILRRIEAGIKARIEKPAVKKPHRRIRGTLSGKKGTGEEKAEMGAASKPQKPLSKYANRKAAEHRGRNMRSRRRKAAGPRAAKNLGGRRKG